MLTKPQANFRNVGIPTALRGTLSGELLKVPLLNQEQVPLLNHVVHEHKFETKPKISECFMVTFVEQPSYDYLDICEDKWRASNRDTHLYPPHNNSSVYLTTYEWRSGRITKGMRSGRTTPQDSAF